MHGFYIFFQACYVICRLTASISFFYDFLLNIRLNNKASSSHDCLHSMLSIVYVTKLLFSLYLLLRLHPSLLASHCSQVNCTGASLNKIVEFKRSLVYCAVQFSFHVHDLPWFLLIRTWTIDENQWSENHSINRWRSINDCWLAAISMINNW